MASNTNGGGFGPFLFICFCGAFYIAPPAQRQIVIDGIAGFAKGADVVGKATHAVVEERSLNPKQLDALNKAKDSAMNNAMKKFAKQYDGYTAEDFSDPTDSKEEKDSWTVAIDSEHDDERYAKVMAARK